MKVFFTLLLNAKNVALSLFFCLPMFVTAQTLLTENFNSSTTLSTYVGAGANQFDFIGATGGTTPSASSAYISSNRVVLQRTNAGVAAISKTTDLSPTPDFLKIKFKFAVSFGADASGIASPTTGLFVVGSGFATSATTEAAANRHSNLGFTIKSGSSFYLRDLVSSGFTNSATFTGEQQITWYINNSGSSISYANPDGSGLTTSLANDRADVWVGTSLVFTNLAAATASQTLTDFKIYMNNPNGNSAVTIDDIEILTGASALPVSLTNFTAKKTGTTNQLTWATEAETNNKGYDVERQSANGTWAALGFVNGTGKASTYTFEDKGPLSISYYRLRQVDFDGKETLSKVVSVSQDSKGSISITPNPTSDKVNIILTQTNVDNQEATLILFDMTGRQVLTQRTTSDNLQLDLSNLAKGVYLLTVQSNHAVYQEKIVRQ